MNLQAIRNNHSQTLRNALIAATAATVLLIGSACATSNNSSGKHNYSQSEPGFVKKMGFALRTSSRSEHNEKQRMWLSQSLAEAYAADEAPHTIMVKPVAEGRLTSGHGYRLSPTGVPIPRKHKGVDYAAPEGTPVFAADDGIVEKRYISKSYGNYIRIRHANGFSTAYAHLHSINNELQEGSKVNRGQKIAKVGSTGRSTGPHLHFEIIHNGTFIDPLFDRLKSKRAEGSWRPSAS